MTEATFVRHTSCPSCNSSDARSEYSDGHSFCFSCNTFYPSNVANDRVVPRSGRRIEEVKIKGTSVELRDRNIKLDTVKKYGVKMEYDSEGSIAKHYYPYHNVDGEITGFKTRVVKDKDFFTKGDISGTGLFGQNLFNGGKYLTITEGELDAMAAYEMLGSRWAVVSIKTGAKGAVRDIKRNFEWVDKFNNIVLAFDQDKAGIDASREVAKLFSPDKVKIMHFEEKDACDMNVRRKGKEFTQAFWNARPFTPAGIISGLETWGDVSAEDNRKSIPYPWGCLNEFTYGFRPQELVTITSGSGMGKSLLVRELEHYLITKTEDNIGILALEESVKTTSLGIMSVNADKQLHLPDNKVGKDELHGYWQNTVGTGRVFMYDHFGSTGEDDLINKIKYMAKGLDCKWIILDHLSIVVSGMEGENERQLIDRLMTKLRTLVQETGIGMFLVSHLRRPIGDKGHERGAEVSLSQLRGSHAIAQLSDMVLGLERDQQHEDEEVRNTTLVRVIKNRFIGLTGPACYLFYDKHTGRLEETENPEGEGNEGDF